MLKDHPKGLLVAFFTNMGERFGFYTMMAILVMFLQARYGLTAEAAGGYYSWFYFAIYALALVGGLLADWTKKYKTVIFAGQVIMFAGYCIMAVPGSDLWVSISALFVIALGNGLFKGNLQAVVGQMYDNPKYSKVRDSAFMIFYMGINIGAFFAPFVAKAIKVYWLKMNGYIEDSNLPSLCHQFINNTLKDNSQLQKLADASILKDGGKSATDLSVFAHDYIKVFSTGYNYAFGIAAGAMILSLVIYLVFNKFLPSKSKIDNAAAAQNKEVVKMPWSEEKPRLIALGLVFLVVIFFWMSFHQNGLTLTMFARDYTAKTVAPFTNLFFNLESMLCVIATIAGCALVFFNSKKVLKVIGGAMFFVFGYLCYYFASSYPALNIVSPEVFQSFNPLFIVALTPLVMGFFSWLNTKGKEPSSPRKIGIGMFIAAIGFVLILIASLNIISPKDLDGAAISDSMRVSPYWLMSSYLILTIAELFLSPIGLSFVAKVAPPRFQGLMQGGWLGATAIGNKLLFVGSFLWGRIELYFLWAIFVICCILAAIFIFSIMKRLEKVTN